MDVFNYLIGKGGLMILALIAVFALLIRTYKKQRYFKHVEKRIKNKDS